MNYQYRIKVEEKNNGEKRYIPQVATPKLTICKRSVYPWLDWYNLIPELDYKHIYDPKSQLLISKEIIILSVEKKKVWNHSVDNEQEANDVIEFHKEQERRIEENKVKNVYFINK
jgi:hypothetical protein